MDALTRSLRAIADPTRRRLLELLVDGERSASDLADRFDLGRPSISKHLGSLKEAGLVKARSKGRQQIYKLNPKPLGVVREWVERCDSDSTPENDPRLAKKVAGTRKKPRTTTTSQSRGEPSSRPSALQARTGAARGDWQCW